MELKNFQKRINYLDDLKPLLETIIKDYCFSSYVSHRVVEMGYEDFNVILEAIESKYFVKMFANFREEKDAKRYVDLMCAVLNAGVRHPNLYKSNQGYLHKLKTASGIVYLCVIEYIEGYSFYEMSLKPTEDEMRFLVRQSAIINNIDIELTNIYDDWAIVNFIEQYELKNKFLSKEDKKLIEPLIEQFKALKIETLPACLVHGDIIKTNVMRDLNGKIYILDFSVANKYPRIQELAVLLCNILFDEDAPETFTKNYSLALEEYQKYIQLTKGELVALPLYTKVAHAMHVICPLQIKVEDGVETAENNYWLELGRKGLKCTSNIWK